MGFLRRLLGGTQRVQLQLSVVQMDEARPDAVTHVVGEVYRQADVLRARPPGPDELPPGLRPPIGGQFKAILIREPSNEYDRNAIRVAVWAGADWAFVGYLSRENAIAYQPVFALLGEREPDPSATPALACDAALVPERDGVGVVLNLGTPGELAAELWIDGHPLRSDHPLSGKLISFTGADRTTLAGAPLDRHAQEFVARKAGCLFAPRVTKKVETLVAADEHEPTGNLSKAREYGIPIVAEVDFLGSIGFSPEAISRTAGRWVRG